MKLKTADRIIIILPTADANYGHVRERTRNLCLALEKLDIPHTEIDSDDPEFLAKFINSAKEGVPAIYTGHRYYDVYLSYSVRRKRHFESLFDTLGVPPLATIADHPFNRIMWTRLRHASPSTHFITGSFDLEREAKFMNPRLRNFHHIASPMTHRSVSRNKLLALSRREIDILLPCTFYNFDNVIRNTIDHYSSIDKNISTLIENFYYAALNNYTQNILDIYLEVYRKVFGINFSPSDPMEQKDYEVLQILSRVDLAVRHSRRIEALRLLARLDPQLKIVVTANSDVLRSAIPDSQSRNNINVIGRVSTYELRELYLNSKLVVNVNPTYVDSISDRIKDAMNAGCCVVTDFNNAINETFKDGESIIFMNGENVAQINELATSEIETAQGISDRSKDIAEQKYSIDQYTRNIVSLINTIIQ